MAVSSETIVFEHKEIGAVLNQYRLAVPLNQREYAWEDEHVTDLFQDFGNAVAKKVSYFSGAMVLTRGKDLPEVSDGQQRLATTTILLAAVRDYFLAKGENRARIQLSGLSQDHRFGDRADCAEVAPECG